MLASELANGVTRRGGFKLAQILKLIIGLFLILGLAQANSLQTSIPKPIQQKMLAVTWHPGCPVPLSQLAYIKLPYWGFDHKPHQGVLIINKMLAPEVIKIFKQLYLQKFPIKQMRPMYEFQGDDALSMAANNTSAFNCRKITGASNKFSTHAYGRAIDINPVQNPYVRGKQVLPPAGKAYLNRNKHQPGMILPQSKVYQTFQNYHWIWGDSWHTLKDYQHFEAPQRKQTF